MNVLLLSVGTRNKLVQYFKNNIDGKVIAADMQHTAPALYEADVYYLVPPLFSEDYFDEILSICKKESVDAVLSLIDTELGILAKEEKVLLEMGVKVIGSSPELCEISLNKMKMHKWMTEKGYNCAKSYDDINAFFDDLDNEIIDFPVFVKPISGSASDSIFLVDNKEKLKCIFGNSGNMMIQEFINGQEIGVDCYIDIISGELVSVFSKKKIRMRAGETDKSVSFKNKKLFDLVARFVKDGGWRGVIDIDIFDVDGEYYINEVNPRFGGGYPHAYECGCNFIKLIENNVLGEVNIPSIGSYKEGAYMMKYCEVVILDA